MLQTIIKNNTSRGEEYEHVLEIIFDFWGRFLFVKILECVLKKFLTKNGPIKTQNSEKLQNLGFEMSPETTQKQKNGIQKHAKWKDMPSHFTNRGLLRHYCFVVSNKQPFLKCF